MPETIPCPDCEDGVYAFQGTTLNKGTAYGPCQTCGGDRKIPAPTIANFIESIGIDMKAEPFPMRPDGFMSDSMRHFKCTLRKWRRNSADEICAACLQRTEGPLRGTKHQMEGVYPRESIQCNGQWEKMGPYITVWFSQGNGHKKPPTAADVLDCLASDASGYENSRNFADWCAEYGYDDDSRTAERIYHTIAEQAKELRHFLGGQDIYDRLLWETERQ